MRKHFKFIAYLAVAIVVSSASAGSYDDFFAAIRKDDPAAIQNLLRRGFDPNSPGPDGSHGLYLALRDGSLKAAGALIESPKTQVDARTAKDETPLMMASLRGQLELARKLVARGADVVKTGWTPLHYAATNGHIPVMELLIEEHAYIDAEAPNGTTPLMMAAMYGTPAAVRFLLEAGADPTLKNQLGMSATDFASKANRPDSAQLIAAAAKAWREKYKR
ncbi:ankyrin repeat domain-containing protein [Ramlibacter sp. PS4R-6]|uniref:ankyrin repeat domain-containing protein n=1 Tax=Ramlibacter sp. PS4R-6 TaxID=3133438 RepID=UPI00309F5C69